MMNFDEICYKHNFLKEVILRMDFDKAYPEFSEKLPKDLESCIRKFYPIFEPSIAHIHSFHFNAKEFKDSKPEEFNKWIYRSKDSGNKIIFERSAIIISLTTYDNFDKIYSELKEIFTEVEKINNDLQIRRLGLRYINHIKLTGDPFNWNGIIEENLINKFSIDESDINPVKLMTILIYKKDDCLLQFQYGMPNPDFPALIKKRFFVLDYDAFFEGILPFKDIDEYVDKLHGFIQIIFEKSVTDNFKKDVLIYEER